jgi:hypothetical protein
MKDRRLDPIASQLADGEAPRELESRRDEPAVRAEVAEIRRLSDALQPPRDVAEPDPFFVMRFRARRDAMTAAAESALPWRRAAQYLLPLAAGALVGAVLAIVAPREAGSALGELEMRELGKGVADVTLETTSVEPVLRIALGEL